MGLIECCEESGSYDLPAYLEHLGPRLGEVDLVIGLDSGCGNYEQLWVTTSLRGLAAGTLTVEVLTEGVHSGDASGVVPSSFRIARACCSTAWRTRRPDASCRRSSTARSRPSARSRRGRPVRSSAISVYRKFPLAGATRPMATDFGEAILNRTWRPYLALVGADGLPAINDAGNVLRPTTALKLSLRLPPLIDGAAGQSRAQTALRSRPSARRQRQVRARSGREWMERAGHCDWLETALQRASQACYGRPAAMMGEGGTIPFMAMLGKQFPRAQFLITGVLGPKSNAHGPNEFLDLACAQKLTTCVAQVLAAHARA